MLAAQQLGAPPGAPTPAAAFIWKVGSCYTTKFITGEGGLYHIFLLYNMLYAPVIQHVLTCYIRVLYNSKRYVT
jgi:hypothetical protein